LKWFSIYGKYNGGKVYVGDGSHLTIVVCGRVLIRFPNDMVKGINGFLHIPNLVRNLLSMRTLNDMSVQVVFSNAGCSMVRGDMVPAKFVHLGILFQLDACSILCNSSLIPAFNTSTKSTPSSPKPTTKMSVEFTHSGHALWIPRRALALKSRLLERKTMLRHQRMGHIYEKGIRALKPKILLRS
jgi:hypothetical protein